MRTIYTAGSSNRAPEEFLELLCHYGISCIIDVRRFPTSRYPHFKKDNLRILLEKAGLRYLSMGKELGGFREGRYEEYMRSELFQGGLSRLEEVAAEEVCAVLCAEKLPWRCHRQFIGQALQERRWNVIHIIDREHIWEKEDKPGSAGRETRYEQLNLEEK